MCHGSACSEHEALLPRIRAVREAVYGLILCPLFFLLGGDHLHQALYRKWRPAAFSDVVGQEHITKVLEYQAANGKLSHAYLFCGSRGTGKTTCAKILAKAANCEHLVDGDPCNKCESCRSIDLGRSLDVLEMDAASNTGVDYIRDIRDEVIYTPSEMGTRVYIIDEVHMLSESAFNALLKTLEEPPPKVIFVLATTELQKIPATIVSRCQRFDFRRISIADLVSRLHYIADNEGIDLTDDGARLIAKLSQGGMRDSISMLELCASEETKVSLERVEAAAGVVGRESITRSVRAIIDKKPKVLLSEVASVFGSSRDVSVYLGDIAQFYRDMMVQKAMNVTSAASVSKDILDVTESELSDLIQLASMMRYSMMVYHSKLIESALMAMNRGADKRITAEMTLMRMCSEIPEDSNEALSARIDALDEKLMQYMAGTLKNAPVERQMSTIEQQNEHIDSRESEAPSPKETTESEYLGWQSLMEAYEKVDKGAAAFLANATAACLSDGQLVVKLRDAFAKTILSDKKAPDALRSLAAAQGDTFTSVELMVEKKIVSKNAFDDLF